MPDFVETVARPVPSLSAYATKMDVSLVLANLGKRYVNQFTHEAAIKVYMSSVEDELDRVCIKRQALHQGEERP
jgi:hypothetical protein